MRGKQQKSQTELAFMSSAEVKPTARSDEGTETLAAGSRPESQAGKLLCLVTNRVFAEPPWYGPVCRVVWEGGAARLLPIPIQGKRVARHPGLRVIQRVGALKGRQKYLRGHKVIGK